MTMVLQGDSCSRCGRHERELHAYHFSEVIYRGRRIVAPWLCLKCFKAEKAKAWKKAVTA